MTADQPPPLPFPRDHYFALSVAQPISTAYPRLPLHPAEQFIIPGDEEYGGRQVGWGGWGVDVQLGAGQQAGDKKTLIFRSCVTCPTSQLTEK